DLLEGRVALEVRGQRGVGEDQAVDAHPPGLVARDAPRDVVDALEAHAPPLRGAHPVASFPGVTPAPRAFAPGPTVGPAGAVAASHVEQHRRAPAARHGL